MKGRNILLSLFIGFLTLSCAGISPKIEPIASQKAWKDKPQQEVYQSCFMALHKKGYKIEKMSREQGMIETYWNSFKKDGATHRYKITMNFSPIQENGASGTSVQTKVKYQKIKRIASTGTDSMWQAPPVLESEWDDISKDAELEAYLDELFKEIENSLGPFEAR